VLVPAGGGVRLVLRELRPAAEVIEFPGVGHYPQIEVPDEFTAGAKRLLQL
jgi:pimeloyl-ACP methyl ester carboxylesterase